MDLDGTRRKLIDQHAELRRLLREAEDAAHALLEGRVPRGDLRELLLELQQVAENHAVEEERILLPVLQTADAWGPERVAIMMREHTAEHEALNRAIAEAAAAGSALDLVNAANALARELRAHMSAEEKYLLDRDVLTSSVVRVTVPD